MQFNDNALGSVAKPARYTGGEWNMVQKDPVAVDVRFALVLPDVYDVGMSNLGLKILYGILNERADTYAERAYCPWPDMEAVIDEVLSRVAGALEEVGRKLPSGFPEELFAVVAEGIRTTAARL